MLQWFHADRLVVTNLPASRLRVLADLKAALMGIELTAILLNRKVLFRILRSTFDITVEMKQAGGMKPPVKQNEKASFKQIVQDQDNWARYQQVYVRLG
jgi:hypothetical protein